MEKTSSINIKVGTRIKKIREDKKWTQADLAFNADLHRAYIGQIERGEKNIGLVNLEKIAISLGVPIQTFFD
jgi:transcriptional regulator with XRE-family HTH domain